MHGGPVNHGRRMRMWVAGILVAAAAGTTARPVRGQTPDFQARVWLSRGPDAVLRRGDRERLYYRASEDAYLAIFQIDTDGTVRLLHPRIPDEDYYVRGGRDYRLLFPRTPDWQVDDDPGVGYFFVVASDRPMDFSAFHFSRQAGDWDLSAMGGPIHGDPYAAMDDYVDRLVPPRSRALYALDFVQYHVGRDYEYPRFLCYRCHGFRPYRSWNPYHYVCRSFRLVIHTDPYFYPVTRYRGTRVVYTRPPVPRLSRFEFRERGRGEPGDPVYRRRDPDRSRREVGRGRAPAGDDSGSRGDASRPDRPPVRRAVPRDGRDEDGPTGRRAVPRGDRAGGGTGADDGGFRTDGGSFPETRVVPDLPRSATPRDREKDRTPRPVLRRRTDEGNDGGASRPEVVPSIPRSGDSGASTRPDRPGARSAEPRARPRNESPPTRRPSPRAVPRNESPPARRPSPRAVPGSEPPAARSSGSTRSREPAPRSRPPARSRAEPRSRPPARAEPRSAPPPSRARSGRGSSRSRGGSGRARARPPS